jgi:hypothetical protein
VVAAQPGRRDLLVRQRAGEPRDEAADQRSDQGGCALEIRAASELDALP